MGFISSLLVALGILLLAIFSLALVWVGDYDEEEYGWLRLERKPLPKPARLPHAWLKAEALIAPSNAGIRTPRRRGCPYWPRAPPVGKPHPNPDLRVERYHVFPSSGLTLRPLGGESTPEPLARSSLKTGVLAVCGVTSHLPPPFSRVASSAASGP